MNERTVVRACTEVPPKSEEADLLQSRGRREDAEIGGARKIRTERRLELNSPAHPDPGRKPAAVNPTGGRLDASDSRPQRWSLPAVDRGAAWRRGQ